MRACCKNTNISIPAERKTNKYKQIDRWNKSREKEIELSNQETRKNKPQTRKRKQKTRKQVNNNKKFRKIPFGFFGFQVAIVGRVCRISSRLCAQKREREEHENSDDGEK